MKVRLKIKCENSRKGSVLICDPWKGRELIKEGKATEYNGFLANGQNADDQDDHDAMIARRLVEPTPVPGLSKQPIKKVKKDTDNDKLHK